MAAGLLALSQHPAQAQTITPEEAQPILEYIYASQENLLNNHTSKTAYDIDAVLECVSVQGEYTVDPMRMTEPRKRLSFDIENRAMTALVWQDRYQIIQKPTASGMIGLKVVEERGIANANADYAYKADQDLPIMAREFSELCANQMS